MIESAAGARTAAILGRGVSAPRLVALSFVGLIAGGTVGFLVLPGLYTGEPLGSWPPLLIQAGGLGILTLAGVIVSMTGIRMGLEAQEAAGGLSSFPARRGPGRGVGEGPFALRATRPEGR